MSSWPGPYSRLGNDNLMRSDMEQENKTKRREFWKPILQTFSVYRKGVWVTEPYGVMDPYSAYLYIREGVAREQTEQLRRIYDPDKAKVFKQSQFETATFSGVFNRKCDDGLKKGTGYVCFDIDHVSVQHVKDVLISLEQFETVLMFTSPSGHGVKWLVNNRSVFKHVDFYTAVSNYLKEIHHIEVDMQARPLSHGCLLPWDPEVYINPLYL